MRAIDLRLRVLTVLLAVDLGCAYAADGGSVHLQLEVFINGTPTDLIAAFRLLPDGRIATEPSELEQLGVRGAGDAASEQVVLDDLPGLSYNYEEPTQRLMIAVGDDARLPKTYSGSESVDKSMPARADPGIVLNYNLFAATNRLFDPESRLFSGASLTLDGRAFSRFGIFNQSAILRASDAGALDALRLDTTFSYSDQSRLTTYRVGDAITGGLAWTRPIRIGGVQVQRNFELRPDLITVPLPSFAGSAAVPSAAEVYINNVRAFARDVGAGPFRIENLPVVTGSGVATLVLRDAAGHETVAEQLFYASPLLLAPGLSDFSLEAGLPRLAYGAPSDNYLPSPVASATLRHGAFDWLTLEAHVEGGAGLVNGGVGATMRLATSGVMTAAAATSYQNGNAGLQGHLSFETGLFGLRIAGSTQRAFGAYDDMASYFSEAPPDGRAPKELDRITVGFPLAFDPKSNLSLSYVRLVDASGERSDVGGVSWSRPLSDSASISTTAFADFGDTHNFGVLAGMSVSLGDVSSSVSAIGGSGGTGIGFDAARTSPDLPGGVGWRVSGSQTDSAFGAAALAYRSSFARFEGSLASDRHGTRGTAEIDGSIAALGGAVFLAPRIDDAFAVVDTGVGDVGVSYENRQVGRTNARGKLLVPGLRSYQANKIDIDIGNLPVDAGIEATGDVVVPADHSGVLVRFPIRADANAAIVVIIAPGGEPLPAGAAGQVDGGEAFVVGYDGRAFLEGLAAQNAVTVITPAGECHATFDYVPRPGEQVVIGPVVCQ